MSGISSLLSNEIDIVDREILFLITKGNPSSYAVWAAMNKQMQGQGLAYVNIKKRIKRMVGMDILQKVEPAIGTTNIRGRKEYKIATKGIEHLITYAIAHYEEVPRIVEYTADKTTFGKLSMDKIHDTLTFFTSFLKNISDNPEIAARYVIQAEDQLQSLKKQIDSVLEFKEISKVPRVSKPTRKKI